MMRLIAVLFVFSSQCALVLAHSGNLFNFPSCSICDEGLTVSIPDLELPANTAGILIAAATCADVEHMAEEGDYSPFACSILRSAVSEDCGCSDAPVVAPSPPPGGTPVTTPTDVVPTDMPVVAPTDMPVMAPTDLPVMAPSDLPVMAPTDMPVMPVMAPTDMPIMATTDMPVMAPADSTSSEPTDAGPTVPRDLTTDAPVMSPTDVVPPEPTDASPTDMPVMTPTVGEPEEMVPTISPVMMDPTETSLPTESPAAIVTEAPMVAPTAVMTDAPVVAAMPTSAPVTMEPTEAPITMEPTDVPATMAPTGAPIMSVVTTLVPMAAPIAGPAEPTETVSTPVFFTLDNVRGGLSTESENAFAIATGSFLEERVDGATNVQCVVESSDVVRRFLRRELQETNSVAVAGTCSAEPTSPGVLSTEDFTAGVENAFAEGDEAFKARLVAEAPFFDGATVRSFSTTTSPVTAPTVAPATTGTSPTETPVEEGGGLGAGAIAGIVIGALILLCCLGAAVFFAGKGDSSSPAPAPVAAITEEIDTDMVHPPTEFRATKVLATPVASAAAVAAAATGDPSVIKGASTIAGEGGEASTVGGESSSAMSSLKINMLARTVEAPPGKLGIVIDTTLEGPVVHKISDTSPLKGSIFEGDVIVAINEVDTRAMSASAITALMGRTSTMRRDLTVLSQDIAH